MATTTKRGPRQSGLRKKLKSNVEDFKDIQWKTNTGNEIIDSAIVNDDFTLTIIFQGKDYQVRSPDRRIIKKVMRYRKLSNKRDLTEEESFDMDDSQDEFVEDVIQGLKIDGEDRISEQEFDNLNSLCWQYWSFSKKKSVGQLSDSI